MKTLTIIITLFSFLVLSATTFAQFDIEKKIKKKLEKEAEKEIDKGIDKGYEEGKEVITNGGDDHDKGENDKDEKDQEKPETDKDPNTTVDTESDQAPQDDQSKEGLKVWSKYDFVSGDKIIFEDDLLNEQHGEFPSKWDLVGGNAENAMFGNEMVIAFMTNKTEIAPLMETEEYLPEVFTIEFDIYFYQKYNEAYYLSLKNQKKISIRKNKVSMGSSVGEPDKNSTVLGWHHIALSFNKRALKVYFDQSRVLNIPNIKTRPTAVMFSALSHGGRRGDPSMIKNIRIAEGGVELYDKLMTDGKIVTTGIRFDINKATIKPESMGVLNEIAKLMKDHSDIKFSVEGHTDSDGDDASNQKLSEARANSVKNALVELGIDASRLETKGFGESNPVSDNSTPEGKAENRRVEFVKI